MLGCASAHDSGGHQEVVSQRGNCKEEVVEFPKDTISRVNVDFKQCFLSLPIWEEEVLLLCVLLLGADLLMDLPMM